MAAQFNSGVVQGLEGILIKNNGKGEQSVVKQGAPINDGDTLILLSGQGYLQMLGNFPTALMLNQPVHIDGVSPLIQPATQQSMVDDMIAEAIAKGIGDYTLEISATTNKVLNQIESARFLQSGGGLIVEFEAGMTGYVYAVGEAGGLG